MALLPPEQAFQIYQEVLNTEDLLDDRDNIYFKDLKQILISQFSLCELFLNVSYLHARYLEGEFQYYEINPFEWEADCELLRLLKGVKTLLVYDMTKLFIYTAKKCEEIITNRENRSECSVLLCQLVNRNIHTEITEPEILSNGWENMYRFAEYITKASLILNNMTLSSGDKDMLLAVSIYYSFLNYDSEMHWLDMCARISSCISQIQEPLGKISNFKQLQGVLVHRLFDENYAFPKKKLKEISDWILSIYKKYLDFWEDQVNQFKSAIDRSEYSQQHHDACSDGLRKMKYIIQAIQFQKWSVVTIIMKQADRVWVGLKWCDYKLSMTI